MHNSNNFENYDTNNSIDDNLDEDYIRPPDSIKKERLLDENLYDDYLFNDTSYNTYMNNVYEESKKEYENRIQLEQEYEKHVIQDYLNTVEKNKARFQPLLNDIKRLSKFDTEVKEIYDIIEPIIQSHCANLLSVVEFEHITYNRIYKVLGSIRTDKKCIEELQKVIIREV